MTPKSSPAAGVAESLTKTISGAEPAPASVDLISNIVPALESSRTNLREPGVLV